MVETSNNASGFPLSEQIKRDYNIVRLLGRGGMGEVYLAEQLRVGRRQVALKVLNRACSEDPEIVKRFENEAASAGRIHHRNVVMVFESRTTDDGQLYVAMEYVDGQSLRDLIAEQGALPLETVIEITRQVCAGLYAAHKLGIVHRDIKPDNIMLARDEDGALVVKVLDFGIARLSEPGATGTQTKTGVVMGTPFYMSPEQAMGNTGDKIDSRSDLYSLGMVVYQMLTGKVAFESDSWMRVMYRHIHEAPLPPSQLRPELGYFEEVESIVLKSLEKDREDRQQSVTEFAIEIEAAYTRAKATAPEEALTAVYGATVVAGQLPFTPTTSPVPEKATSGPSAPATQSGKAVSTGSGNAGAAQSAAGGLLTRKAAVAGMCVLGVAIAVAVYFTLNGNGRPTTATEPASPGGVPASSPMPAMEKYSFEIVSLTRTGQMAGARRGHAQFFSEDLAAGVEIDMIQVPGGSFLMGSPDKEEGREANEGPQQKVTVQPFFIGKYEVTQAQWSEVARMPRIARDLDLNPSTFKENAKIPVHNVSWWDAVEFCQRLARATGRQYRLPTEAEWEYACRAGTTSPFYFGETIIDDLVNFDARYPYGGASKGETRKQPVPVGTLGAPNSFGIHSMHGNMAEWCLDPWHDNFNGAPTDGSLWESGGNAGLRVLRGGSWYDGGEDCRATSRAKYAPDIKLGQVGFRVVMVPSQNQ
jgi:formylglycine-generating enzyme required for sulfatase activity/serine/threonine protein kinase